MNVCAVAVFPVFSLLRSLTSQRLRFTKPLRGVSIQQNAKNGTYVELEKETRVLGTGALIIAAVREIVIQSTLANVAALF